MNELRLGILQRIAKGEITPKEGQVLLDQVEEDSIDNHVSPSWRKTGYIPVHIIQRILTSSSKMLRHDFVELLKTKNFKIPYREFRELISKYVLEDFIFEIKNLGYSLSNDEMANFIIYDITPIYIADLRNSGFTNLNIDEIIKLRIHDIVYDYISHLKSQRLGYFEPISKNTFNNTGLINGGNDNE